MLGFYVNMKKTPLLLNQNIGSRDFSDRKIDMDFKNNFLKIFSNNNFNLDASLKILIFTSLDDSEINNLGPYLIKHNIDYIRVNGENFMDYFKFTLKISNAIDNNELSFTYFNKTYFVNDFDYIWVRRFSIDTFDFCENFTEIENKYFKIEWRDFFSALLELYPEKLLVPVYHGISKPRQLITAKKVGLKIPNTIITNSIDSIKDFFGNNSGKIFAKALKHHSIDNNDGTLTDFYGLTFSSVNEIEKENVQFAPVIYQNQIDKLSSKEFRVNVFKKYITSFTYENITEDDWHFEDINGIKMSEKKIPEDIQKKILDLFHELNLHIGTVDLIEHDDNWYFLEVNTGGDWKWLENSADVNLSEEIVQSFLQL